jgi:hypothetical protein
MPPQALAALATLVGFAPHGNQVELKLDRGSAELVWVSPSAFHFRRTLDGSLPPAIREGAPEDDGAIPFEIDETSAAVRVRSRFIEVTIEKRGVLVKVRRLDGSPLMADLSAPRPSGAGYSWERQMLPQARYYGFGPRADAVFDLRGKTPQPDTPFLFSTLGYGEYHPAPGPYRFDFTAYDRYRLQAPAIDYFFYYGPTVKQVMEEHRAVRGNGALWPAATIRFGSWASLRSALLRVVQGAMSAMLTPTLDLSPYAAAAPELRERARQLGSLIAEVSPGPLGFSDLRNRLASFFDVYAVEAHEKGYPPWHPLPFQFPEDPECALHADEFMLGDELLVAPIVEPGNSRSLYLPQGVWTNLATNESLPGRRAVTVTGAALPVFARNGTIVPFNSGSGLALHYFPKLGAEFFLVEDDGWTQLHAAPAADILRLEIESRQPREYEWVVHHVDRPVEVGFDGLKFREASDAVPGKSSADQSCADKTWRYDPGARNLTICIRVEAGADSVVNVDFGTP